MINDNAKKFRLIDSVDILVINFDFNIPKQKKPAVFHYNIHLIFI